jgi:hypothetical protein
MSPVTIVGLVVGTGIITTAIVVFLRKNDFPAGGVGATAVGMVLIGMSQWTSITLKAGGVDVELQALQKQLDSTAASAAVVSDEAHKAAAAADVARQQITTLTTQLATKGVLTPQSANAIRTALAVAPHSDTTRLRLATDQLRNLTRVRERPPPP